LPTESNVGCRALTLRSGFRKKLGCSHAEVIENMSAKQLFAMQRRNSIGDDLGEELAEISVRLAAKRKDSV
jgi:hypothetical protein